MPVRSLATCLVLFQLFLPRPALAGPVEPKHVAADAKWYLHLDFDAAKQTVLYTTLLDALRAQHPIDDTVAQIKQFIGVNPLTDINGVTIYNTSFEKEVAAVIIYAKGYDQNLLTNALAQNRDYKEVDYDKHTLLSWTDNNDGKHKTGCFYAPGIVVMADKETTLKLAVDVLDGTKPGGSPLAKPLVNGTFIQASANLAEAAERQLSHLLSTAEAANARLAEVDGKFTLTVNVTAKNAETGTQIRKMVDGAKAFGELVVGNEHPAAAALIRQVQVTSDGTHLSITFSHDSKTILDTLQQLDREEKAKRAKQAEDADKPKGL